MNLLTNADRETIYALVNHVENVSNVLGIPLYAIGGTLLGAVREKDVICWDDDVDYMILEKDVDKLESKAMKDFITNNVDLIFFKEKHPSYRTVYHIALNDGKQTPENALGRYINVDPKTWGKILKGQQKQYHIRSCIFLDIFIYVKQKTNDIYDLPHDRKQYIHSHQLMPTKYTFGNTQITSISDPESYLIHTFGCNYMTPKQTHRHRTSRT
jgi:hypothetical protein